MEPKQLGGRDSIHWLSLVTLPIRSGRMGYSPHLKLAQIFDEVRLASGEDRLMRSSSQIGTRGETEKARFM